ncbi:MAG: leucine-rich repeat domain-containing protein, partial [Treponema sp.]|nr:leucine-rich repeat domain-containing protein [Treponema sp.]
MKKAVLVVLFLGFVFAVFGQNVSDFEYTQNNDRITITKYNGSVKNVVIPERINNRPVVAIGNWAFSGNQLTSITLPNSITSIGYEAFEDNQLTRITLPNSLTSIGDYAFASNQLTSITLPNSLASIGNWAFSGNQLTSITLPNSITSIGYEAFEDNQLTSIILPNSLTSIGDYAFASNQLTSITLPKNVTIQPHSFNHYYVFESYTQNNKEAKTFVISHTTFNVFETAIFDDTKIEITRYKGSVKNVVIPEKINNLPVVAIGDSAFSDNQLTSITLPNSLTSIGDWAFRNNQLTSITLPNSITSIGDSAFRDNRLTSITLPNSITSIGS